MGEPRWEPCRLAGCSKDIDLRDKDAVLAGWVTDRGIRPWLAIALKLAGGPNDSAEFPAKEEAMRYVETCCRLNGWEL